MKLELDVDVSDDERALLAKEGYEPVVWWKRRNTYCTTGEALKNIEIEARRKHCKHARGGSFDSCRYCGALMPWV